MVPPARGRLVPFGGGERLPRRSRRSIVGSDARVEKGPRAALESLWTFAQPTVLEHTPPVGASPAARTGPLRGVSVCCPSRRVVRESPQSLRASHPQGLRWATSPT